VLVTIAIHVSVHSLSTSKQCFLVSDIIFILVSQKQRHTRTAERKRL